MFAAHFSGKTLTAIPLALPWGFGVRIGFWEWGNEDEIQVKKMKTKLIFFLLLLYITLPLQSAFAKKPPPFHPPKTEAEKALDRIFMKSDSDDNLFRFILNRPDYNPSKNYGYERFFTKELLKSWRETEADIKKGQHCNYNEGLCGMDISPITCGQDGAGHLFKTIKQTDNEAIMTYISEEIFKLYPDTKTPYFYKLIKQEGIWKLDGVDCDEVKFNTYGLSN
jgi:hypothetical protein